MGEVVLCTLVLVSLSSGSDQSGIVSGVSWSDHWKSVDFGVVVKGCWRQTEGLVDKDVLYRTSVSPCGLQCGQVQANWEMSDIDS